MLGPLLGVEISKEWTPKWHEAHLEVKMYKTKSSEHSTKLQLKLQLQLQRQLLLYSYKYNCHYNYNYNYTTPHYIQQLWVR